MMASGAAVEPVSLPKTEVYRFCSPPAEEAVNPVEFRLVYQGPLDPQTSQSRVKEKHAIRRALHPQLRELWNQIKALKVNIDYFSDQYKRNGFRFVPLINGLQARYCS